eukprot:762182-Hanusia_phi.AAC.1
MLILFRVRMSSQPWRQQHMQMLEHEERRRDVVARSSRTTYSTEQVGRGLGVAEWIQVKKVRACSSRPRAPHCTAWQPVERRWQWDLDEDRAAPPPASSTAAASRLPSLLRRVFGLGLKEVRAEDEADTSKTEEQVPTTLLGLMAARVKEGAGHWKSKLDARREYQKRLRMIYGPGPMEQVFTWYVVLPASALLRKVEAYMEAYIVILRIRLAPSSSHKEKGLTWRKLEKLQNKIQMVQAICVAFTVSVALIVYELQFRGYIPSWTEDCRNAFSNPSTCVHNTYCSYHYSQQESKMVLSCLPITSNLNALTKLKWLNVAVTVWMIWNLFITYEYEHAIRALRNHVEFRDKKLRRYSMIETGLVFPFIAEVVSLAVVQIPFLQFEVIVQTSYFSTRPSVYSFDGILAIVMSARTFQVWKWYRADLFAKFESRQYGVRINDDLMGSWLAIRFLVLKHPFLASFQFFLTLILVGSYIFRIAESSTNSVIAVYYWDSLWFVIDTALGLPVAESAITPSTSFGRMLAILIRGLGMLWFALLIAAIRLLMRFDAKEIEFFGWLRLSKLFQTLRTSAARLIQYLWMYRQSGWVVAQQRRRFRKAKKSLAKFESGIEDPERWDFGAFTRAETRRISDIRNKVSSYANLLEKILSRSSGEEDLAGVVKQGGRRSYYSDSDSEDGERTVMLSGMKFGGEEEGRSSYDADSKYGGMNYEVMLTKKEKRIRRRKQLEEQVAVCRREAEELRRELERVMHGIGIVPEVVDKDGVVIPPAPKEIQPWELKLIAMMDVKSARFEQMEKDLSEVETDRGRETREGEGSSARERERGREDERGSGGEGGRERRDDFELLLLTVSFRPSPTSSRSFRASTTSAVGHASSLESLLVKTRDFCRKSLRPGLDRGTENLEGGNRVNGEGR